MHISLCMYTHVFFKDFIYFLIGEKLLYNFVLVSHSFDLHFSNNERYWESFQVFIGHLSHVYIYLKHIKLFWIGVDKSRFMELRMVFMFLKGCKKKKKIKKKNNPEESHRDPQSLKQLLCLLQKMFVEPWLRKQTWNTLGEHTVGSFTFYITHLKNYFSLSFLQKRVIIF